MSAEPTISAEVAVAREIDCLGSHTGYGFRDHERIALHRLVGLGYVKDDLAAARRFTLTAVGRAWLAEQEV